MNKKNTEQLLDYSVESFWQALGKEVICLPIEERCKLCLRSKERPIIFHQGSEARLKTAGQ